MTGQNKKPRTLIFDFDFTLGDSSPGIYRCVNHAMEKLGRAKCKEDKMRACIGLSLEKVYSTLTQNDDVREAALFKQYFVELADEIMADLTTLYQGVHELIRDLKSKGYKLGIVSTKFSYRNRAIMEREGLLDCIDAIVGADNVRITKPDPEGLLMAMELLSSRPSETLYIGDHPVDAEASLNAGTHFAAVLSGTHKAADFEKYSCLFILDSVCDLDTKLRNNL